MPLTEHSEQFLNVRSTYAPAFDPRARCMAFPIGITGASQAWALHHKGRRLRQWLFLDGRIGGLEWPSLDDAAWGGTA